MSSMASPVLDSSERELCRSSRGVHVSASSPATSATRRNARRTLAASSGLPRPVLNTLVNYRQAITRPDSGGRAELILTLPAEGLLHAANQALGLVKATGHGPVRIECYSPTCTTAETVHSTHARVTQDSPPDHFRTVRATSMAIPKAAARSGRGGPHGPQLAASTTRPGRCHPRCSRPGCSRCRRRRSARWRSCPR